MGTKGGLIVLRYVFTVVLPCVGWSSAFGRHALPDYAALSLTLFFQCRSETGGEKMREDAAALEPSDTQLLPAKHPAPRIGLQHAGAVVGGSLPRAS